MGDTTDELLDLAQQITPVPPSREMDILLTAGEHISMSLLAMAIHNLGVSAKSFTGQQAGVITNAVHGKARIVDVVPARIRETLDKGSVVIVAGFQGVTQRTNDVTTLGRGGSDTTAVALAAGLNADVCEIYSDVDGVYTADPRIVRSARKIDHVTYDEMLEMAANGAKILIPRCVEYGRRYSIPIHVRSSFTSQEGTWVTEKAQTPKSVTGEVEPNLKSAAPAATHAAYQPSSASLKNPRTSLPLNAPANSAANTTCSAVPLTRSTMLGQMTCASRNS